ncbi:MAG: hypothetical protein K6G61_08660 [Solobacterium sp.]|nr:hypothetical protein [Solobacterium sp.]
MKKMLVLAAVFLLGCTSEYPSWIVWHEDTLDVEAEGEVHHLEIRDRKVMLDGEQPFDDDWTCSQMILTDLDQDEEPDILFLMWNHQDYGDHHPFWVEKDTETLNEHVYIYNLRGGYMRPKWMSSMIDPKIKHISTDRDIIYVIDPEDEESVWQWKNYGIERIDLYEDK